MNFSKKVTASASFGQFCFVGQDQWVQMEAKLSAMIRGLSGNGVGQSKWLSAKVNAPNFG